MGPVGCPETSVRNYHYSLCNNPEECGSYISILLCSEKPTIYPNPELDESSPSCCFHIHFNIILPSVPGLSKLSPSLHISPQKPSAFLVSAACATCPTHFILSGFTFTTTASHHQSLSTTYDSVRKQCDIF